MIIEISFVKMKRISAGLGLGVAAVSVDQRIPAVQIMKHARIVAVHWRQGAVHLGTDFEENVKQLAMDESASAFAPV